MPDQDWRLLSSGVDSLYFSASGHVSEGFMASLGKLQGAGAAGEEVASTFACDGAPFLLKGHGLRGYPYWLTAAGYDLMIGKSEPWPPVKAELRSWFLHSLGAEAAVGELCSRLEGDVFDGPVVLIPSRIDVCADIQGWRPHHADFQRFVCRARYRELHQPDAELHGFGNEVSGFTFGKGAVVARIYNKTLEQTVHRDTGASLLWGDYDRDQPVWRIEFQFRRKALIELQVPDGPGVLNGRQGLWRYGTDWLSLRQRSSHQKPSRWPEDPLWPWLRSLAIGLPCNPLIRRRIREANLSRVVSGLVGYLSSLGALTQTDDMVRVMNNALVLGLRYVDERGVPFDRLVNRKAARHAAVWGETAL